MDNITPVGRFAPTPSGRMHLGNVFAALIAWLSVRSRNGEMVLRMEDLDTQRTSAEFAETLRQDLAWLGLDYDREQSPQTSVLLSMTNTLISCARRACSIPATVPAVSSMVSMHLICLTVPTSIPVPAEV